MKFIMICLDCHKRSSADAVDDAGGYCPYCGCELFDCITEPEPKERAEATKP